MSTSVGDAYATVCLYCTSSAECDSAATVTPIDLGSDDDAEDDDTVSCAPYSCTSCEDFQAIYSKHFKFKKGNTEVCADTERKLDGEDGQCSASDDTYEYKWKNKDFARAEQICLTEGSRLCTEYELTTMNVGKGSGCSIDTSGLVWTTDACTCTSADDAANGNSECPLGESGHVISGASVVTEQVSFCATTYTDWLISRCCADSNTNPSAGLLSTSDDEPDASFNLEECESDVAVAAAVEAEVSKYKIALGVVSTLCVLLVVGIVLTFQLHSTFVVPAAAHQPHNHLQADMQYTDPFGAMYRTSATDGEITATRAKKMTIVYDDEPDASNRGGSVSSVV